ncbi:hypothetical protein K8R33_00975 [archaeon]|nr:hypothetical protein [archaeon]
MALEEKSFEWDDLVLASLEELWNSQKTALSDDQKDRIGLAYLEYVLRIDDPTIKEFLDGVPDAYQNVGNRQSDLSKNEIDYDVFWTRVGEICANNQYSLTQTRQLIDSRDPWAIINMMGEISRERSHYPHKNSRVIQKIRVNAHVYK